MSIARNRLQGIDFMLANDPDKLSSKDLMSCERDISQLSDIIEDQYVGFGILASLSSASDENNDIQKTSKIIKGFEPMDKAMLRLEKKGRIIAFAIHVNATGEIHKKDKCAYNSPGHFCSPHLYCRCLWDEFYKYARTQLAIWISVCLVGFYSFGNWIIDLFLSKGLVRLI